MHFEFPLTIPASTLATAPVSLAAPLAPGRIVQVAVQIPRYAAGLAHTYATRSSHQVAPTNPGGTIAGDDAIVLWPEDEILNDAPYEWALWGYNTDDTFSHTLTWRIDVLPLSPAALAAATPPVAPAGLLTRLREALGV